MKAWRESATIIITAQSGLKRNLPYNYNVLLMKRQQNTKFAGSYVFPGGIIESADADLKWHDLFKKHGYNKNSFKSLYPSTSERPEIFRETNGELAREISLRISAIRETFEECGILLCKKASESNISALSAYNFPISSDKLRFWQKKVYADAHEFYNMCENLQCHPNLWALHEWSNWLTPSFLPKKYRYDTIFFFTSLSELPNIYLDSTEMEELIWETPEHVLKSLKDYLPSPQHYELVKMAKYKDINDLIQVAKERSQKGIKRNFPVRVILKNGMAMLLPGDDKYPVDVNPYENEFIDKSSTTIEQFRNESIKTHRMEMFDDPEITKNLVHKL